MKTALIVAVAVLLIVSSAMAYRIYRYPVQSVVDGACVVQAYTYNINGTRYVDLQMSNGMVVTLDHIPRAFISEEE